VISKTPPIIFGTSGLGNLYVETPFDVKMEIINQFIKHAPSGIAMFDTAGKYGAGLALEVLGKCLKQLEVKKEEVIISNKLGWYQTALTTAEPTFEKGVWKNVKNDAIQKISYNGILDCFNQGNELLGDYPSQMASVHDPDEYLSASLNKKEEEKRYNDILESYIALNELKQQGKIMSIGVGAKNWKTIERISQDVNLDWVMFANSLTLHDHPKELLAFIKELNKQHKTIINSAVFNGGYLVGKDFYNYTQVDKSTEDGKKLYAWRLLFFELCNEFDIQPAEACISFGLNIQGVNSIAFSTSRPEKVKENIEMITKEIPASFWDAMKRNGLLEENFTITKN
jgi:D-threo-aldose 1-dehydrogenase